MTLVVECHEMEEHCRLARLALDESELNHGRGKTLMILLTAICSLTVGFGHECRKF